MATAYAFPWCHEAPHNKQLQRTVTRQPVRAAGAAWPLCACGAHDAAARGR